jgi:mono/diheme cytochrome c family protein
MMRFVKWLGVFLGSLIGLAATALLVLWIGGSRVLNKTYDIPATSFVADPSTADLAEGQRLAQTRGCFNGCHGEGLQGEEFIADPIFGFFTAPDLTRAFVEKSDTELEHIVRHGVHPDGRSTFLMPSASFYHMTDEDLNNIFAFIRSQDRTDGLPPRMLPGPFALYMLMTNELPVEAELIADGAPFFAKDDEHYLGKYIAFTVCSECHGMDFQGFTDFTPSLVSIAAYSRDDFHRLMSEGIAVGDRELELMSAVARSRFVHLTEEEESALYAFLKTLLD